MIKRKLFIFLLLPILILLSVYLGGAYFFSGEVINFKQKSLAQDKKNLNITSIGDFGLPQPLEKNFQNGNVSLQSWYFRNPNPKSCGVVLLHGFTGTRWGALKYAPIFWKLGCHIFTYDHRKHGESTGKYGSFGYHEKYDLKKGIEFFIELSNLELDQIGVLGESFGAATALQYAGLQERPAFIISESSYKDLDSIVGKRARVLYGSIVKPFVPLAYFFVNWRAEMNILEVSPVLAAERILVPTLIIHSASDDYTPASHSEDIYQALKVTEKQLVLTDWGSKHARSINDDYHKFEKIIFDFLVNINFPKNIESGEE
jgi:uncharacterized protein